MRSDTVTDWFNAAFDNDHRFIKENVETYVRTIDSTKETALMKAARRNCGSVVEILCNYESGLYNSRGESALMLAIQNNSVDCLGMLCEYESEQMISNGDTPLHYAIRMGCVEAISHLTSRYKRARSKADRTPLEFAAELGSVRSIEHLLVSGTPYTQLEIDQAIERARACGQAVIVSTLPILFKRYWRIANSRQGTGEPVTVEDLRAFEPETAVGEPVVDGLALKNALLSAGVPVSEANSVVRSLSQPVTQSMRQPTVSAPCTDSFRELTGSMRQLAYPSNETLDQIHEPQNGPQVSTSVYQDPGADGVDYANFMGLRGRRDDESVVSADVVDNIVAVKNAEIAKLENALREANARLRMAESNAAVGQANRVIGASPGHIDRKTHEYIPGVVESPLNYCSSRIANDRGDHRAAYRGDVSAPCSIQSPSRSDRASSRSRSRSSSRSTSRSHYGRNYRPEVKPRTNSASNVARSDSARTSQFKPEMLIPPVSQRRLQPGVAGDTDLITAVKNGDIIKFRKYLPHQTRQVDSRGRTALMHAVDRNNTLMITELCNIEAGIQDADGTTALMIAAALNLPLAVSMLVSHEKRFTKRIDGSTALMAAASNGNIDCVDVLARHEKGIQAHDGSTALIHAIRNNRRRCACLLWPLEHAIADRDGVSPRDWAKRFNRQEILKVVDSYTPSNTEAKSNMHLVPTINPSYMVRDIEHTVNLLNTKK
ncbi:Protein 21.1 [Giardia lamblia P15]|uniref:Protein 21.1 n=1 Tax=Giardia intestinalis (strain P15) TaxID=658858 RepID=E1F6I9_GIAIA|nr:Protein 21.1 [Giardia lamblia P15]